VILHGEMFAFTCSHFKRMLWTDVFNQELASMMYSASAINIQSPENCCRVLNIYIYMAI